MVANCRFAALRKNHVRLVCINPKAKPRHEAVDVKMYSERRTSSYVDFQQAGALAG